jgi:glycosyltransferase involved in cell wall biosynthesis
MRLVVNASTLRGAGSARVGRGLLGALASSPNAVTAFAPDDWTLPEPVRHLGTRSGWGAKLWTDQVRIPHALRQADALLSLTDTGTVSPDRPHVLLVHQAYLAYRPEEHGLELPRPFALKIRAMTVALRATLPGVHHITVQTQDMRQRLIERFDLAAERVQVIPSAVEVPASMPERGSSEPYLVYVAAASPHKDHGVLPAVLAAMHHPLPLLLTATAEELPGVVADAERYGVRHRIRFLGRVSHVKALRLQAEATVAVIPSRLESFGLPYYEAVAQGTPVVAWDLPFAREAANDAARYAPVGQAEAFAEAIDATLHDLPEARRRAAVRGQAVARRWEDVGRDYLDLLESLT